MESEKKILLVDLDDARRKTRVRMLERAGYEVETRADHEISERLDSEDTFDLIVLALHRKELDEAAAYSERIRKANPDLPILLLVDAGVFVPRGTLSPSVGTEVPMDMIKEVAGMLAGSTHIREIRATGVTG